MLNFADTGMIFIIVFGCLLILMSKYVRPKWLGYVLIASFIFLLVFGLVSFFGDDSHHIGH